MPPRIKEEKQIEELKSVVVPTDAETPETIALKAIEYLKLKDQEKKLKADLEQKKGTLQTYVEKHGKKDGKGHLVVELPFKDGSVEIKNELRVGTYLEVDAVNVIKSKLDKELVEELIEEKTVEVIDELRLEELITEQVISDEVSAQLYGTKETYALKVRRVS